MAPRRTLAANIAPHAFKSSEGSSLRCITCGRGKASPVHPTASSPGSTSPNSQPCTTTPPHPNTSHNRVPTTTPRPTQCSSLCSVTGSGVRCPADPPCHVIVYLTSDQFAFYWRAPPDLYAHPLKWLGYFCTTCEYAHPLGSCCVQPDPNHKLFHVATDAVLWPPRAHASHYDQGSCPATATLSGGGVSCASAKLRGVSRRVKPTLTFDAGFA